MIPKTDIVDQFFPLEKLHEMLSLADIVVTIVPHTPDTEEMIGAAEFAVMKPGAYFINIARGEVVDEPELIKALQTGHLSGAALDVFAEEPLPSDHPLWTMPNVIISPHSGSTSDRENLRLTTLFWPKCPTCTTPTSPVTWVTWNWKSWLDTLNRLR